MRDFNSLPLPQLFSELVSRAMLTRLIDAALEEDGGDVGDVTTASIIPPEQSTTASIIARRAGVIAGMPIASAMVESTGGALEIDVHIHDGSEIEVGTRLARLIGNEALMLRCERPMLNFLGWLSGIATETSWYVAAVAGTGAAICDTRKTTPGMRHLEKYAVRCGGGTLHRLGLFDAALYKDNHLAHLKLDDLAPTLTEAICRAREAADLRFVEVEVASLEQLQRVLTIEPAGMIDFILLDNMPPEMIKAAVTMRDESGSKVQLEASGGVTLENVRAIAQAGVERISIGRITHSAPWLDIAMDVEPNT